MTLSAAISAVVERFEGAEGTGGGFVAKAGIRVCPEELFDLASELAAAGFSRFEMVTAVDHSDHLELIYLLAPEKYLMAPDEHLTAPEKDLSAPEEYLSVQEELPASLVIRCELPVCGASSRDLPESDVPAIQPHVASLASIWPAADPQEREIFDLFGVVFDGHPNLKRIFLPEDFEGHPLRKDFESPNLIRRPDFI